MIPNKQIPYRYRPQNFQRFASVIGRAVEAFPNAIEINPAPLTPESFYKAFHEAVKSKELFGYASPYINEAKWNECHTQIKASLSKKIGSVIIGSNISFREPLPEAMNEVPDSNFIEFLGTLPEIEMLASFIAKKHFQPEVSFVVNNVSETDRKRIETMFDVIFEQVQHNDPTKHRII